MKRFNIHKNSINYRYLVVIKLVVLALIGISFLIGCSDGEKVGTKTNKNFEGFTVYLKDKDISSIYDDGDYILAGGVEGLYRIGKKDRETQEIKFEEPLQMVRAILRSDKGDLLIGHHNGLTIVSDDHIRIINKEKGLPDNRINDIQKGHVDNELWVSTYEGVGHFIHDKWEIYDEGNGLLSNIIFPILVDSRKNIWFGAYAAHNSGIFILDNNRFTYINIDNGLVNNSITSFLENSEGAVWVGTGLFELGGANLFEYIDGSLEITKTLTIDNGLAGEKVRNLYIDNDNRIWFCSEYDGVAIFDSKGEKRKLLLDISNGLSDNEIKKILQDENGDYWLGTRSGITFIKKDTIDTMISAADKAVDN